MCRARFSDFGNRVIPASRAWEGIRAGLLMLAALLFSAPVIAADIIGAAETISNRVVGELPGMKRVLDVDADVHRNELIRTEAAAAARLRFADRSDLRLGPLAQIRLDAFVFSGNASSAMNLSRGALRFISGNGPTGSYQIRTPVATIGLRGTGVDVVLRQGRAFVTLLDGAARVCANAGSCTDLVNRCDYVEVAAGRAQPARPLTSNIPTFNSACTGAGCGATVCTSSAAPSPSRAGTPATPPGAPPARGAPPGYDPAGGSSMGAGGGGGGGSGGGKGR